MSCPSSKSNSSKGCESNFEDEPVECTTKIPETYKFSCPAGENCDKNNNKPPPPQARPMPKSECSACCGSQPQKTESETECESTKKVFMEDNPPSVTTKLPTTKTFKFPENCDEGKQERKDSKDSKEASDGNGSCKEEKPEAKKSCTSCGAPVPGKPCNCNKPIAPTPKQPPCGCSGKGSNCEANTECATTPLSMKRK